MASSRVKSAFQARKLFNSFFENINEGRWSQAKAQIPKLAQQRDPGLDLLDVLRKIIRDPHQCTKGSSEIPTPHHLAWFCLVEYEALLVAEGGALERVFKNRIYVRFLLVEVERRFGLHQTAEVFNEIDAYMGALDAENATEKTGASSTNKDRPALSGRVLEYLMAVYRIAPSFGAKIVECITSGSRGVDGRFLDNDRLIHGIPVESIHNILKKLKADNENCEDRQRDRSFIDVKEEERLYILLLCFDARNVEEKTLENLCLEIARQLCRKRCRTPHPEFLRLIASGDRHLARIYGEIEEKIWRETAEEDRCDKNELLSSMRDFVSPNFNGYSADAVAILSEQNYFGSTQKHLMESRIGTVMGNQIDVRRRNLLAHPLLPLLRLLIGTNFNAKKQLCQTIGLIKTSWATEFLDSDNEMTVIENAFDQMKLVWKMKPSFTVDATSVINRVPLDQLKSEDNFLAVSETKLMQLFMELNKANTEPLQNDKSLAIFISLTTVRHYARAILGSVDAIHSATNTPRKRAFWKQKKSRVKTDARSNIEDGSKCLSSIFPLTLRLQTMEAIFSLLFLSYGDIIEAIMRPESSQRDIEECRRSYLVDMTVMQEVVSSLQPNLDLIENLRQETMTKMEKGTLDFNAMQREKELESSLSPSKVKNINLRIEFMKNCLSECKWRCTQFAGWLPFDEFSLCMSEKGSQMEFPRWPSSPTPLRSPTPLSFMLDYDSPNSSRCSSPDTVSLSENSCKYFEGENNFFVNIWKPIELILLATLEQSDFEKAMCVMRFFKDEETLLGVLINSSLHFEEINDGNVVENLPKNVESKDSESELQVEKEATETETFQKAEMSENFAREENFDSNSSGIIREEDKNTEMICTENVGEEITKSEEASTPALTENNEIVEKLEESLSRLEENNASTHDKQAKSDFENSLKKVDDSHVSAEIMKNVDTKDEKNILQKDRTTDNRRASLSSSLSSLAETAARGIAAIDKIQLELTSSTVVPSKTIELLKKAKKQLAFPQKQVSEDAEESVKDGSIDQSSLSSSLSDANEIFTCPSPDKPSEFVIRLAENVQSLLNNFGNVVFNINTAKAVSERFEFKRINRCLEEHLPGLDLNLLKTDHDKASFFANLFSLLAVISALKQGSMPNHEDKLESHPEDFVTGKSNPLNNLRYIYKNTFSIGQLGRVNLLDLQLIILRRIFWPMEIKDHLLYSGLASLHPEDAWSIYSPPHEPRLIFFLSFAFKSSAPFQILYPESYDLQLEMATRQLLNTAIDIDYEKSILVIPPQLCWYANLQNFTSDNIVEISNEERESVLDFILRHITAYPMKSQITQLQNELVSPNKDENAIKPFTLKSYIFDCSITIVQDYHHFSDIIKSSKFEAFQNVVQGTFKSFPLSQTDMIFLRNKCPPFSRMASLLKQNYFKTSAPDPEMDQNSIISQDINSFKNRTESDNGTVFLYVQSILNMIITGKYWQEFLSSLFLNPISLVLTSNEILELKNMAYATILGSIPKGHRDFKDTLNSISQSELYTRIILSLLRTCSLEQSIQYLESAKLRLEDESSSQLKELIKILHKKLIICTTIMNHAKCLLKNEIFESDIDKIEGTPDKELDDMKLLAAGWKSVNALTLKRPGFILNVIMQSGDVETAMDWAEFWNVPNRVKYDMFDMILREKIRPENFCPDMIIKILETFRKTLGEEKCAEACEKIVAPGEIVHSEGMISVITYMLNELKLGIDDSRQSQLQCILVGLETLACVPDNMRGAYEELSFEPLLLIEMLIMNDMIDCAANVIKKFRSENLIPDKTFSEKLDRILIEYGKKALVVKTEVNSCEEDLTDESDTHFLKSMYVEKRSTRRISQSMFRVPQEPVNKKDWEPDDDVEMCPSCNQEFSVFFRRHHCRWCGRVICAECSQQKVYISKAFVRICNTCSKFSNLSSSPATSIQDRLKRRLLDQYGSPYHSEIEVSQDDESESGEVDTTPDRFWILTTNCLENEKTRQKFFFKKSPNAELAISIYVLISAPSIVAKELLIMNDQISQLLKPMKMMNHKDFSNILQLLRKLLTESKFHYEMSEQGMGVQTVDSRLSKVDLILKMIQAGISNLPSIDDLERETVAQSLRDRFIAEQRFDLALELSTKLRLDYCAVWRAWGMYCLEQKDFLSARIKFSKFMRPSRDHSNSSEETFLDQLVEFLESFIDSSLKESYSPTDENLPFIKISEEYFEECLFYLKTYGSHTSIIRFYVKHNYIQKAVGYVLNRKVSEDVFVETLLKPSIAKQEVFKLQDQMIMFDPSLNKWLPYLNSCCRYLSRSKYNKLLKEMQLFMKDYLRAAMTCIIMYHTDAKTYSDLTRRATLMTEARHNCEMYLRSKLHLEKSANESTSEFSGFRMTMSAQNVHYHMSKIDQQIEIAQWLASKEKSDPMQFEKLIEMSKERRRRSSSARQSGNNVGISTGNCELPTLFGGSQSKIDVVLILLSTETDVSLRNRYVRSLIEKNNLSLLVCFRQLIPALARLDCLSDFSKILNETLPRGRDEEGQRDEVIVDCLPLFQDHVDESKSELVDSLVSSIRDKNAKIEGLVAANRLKSAYLVAVEINSAAAVEKICTEAKKTRQTIIKNICERWLQQKARGKK